MKRSTTIRLIMIAAICLMGSNDYAQLVNCNAFLQGNYIEVGVNITGAYGTSQAAPAGYHARPGAAGTLQNTCTSSCPATGTSLGFVADPDKDGWTVGSPAYIGDYFLPGNPQEGWSIKSNGHNGNAWNLTGTCGATSLFSGSLTGTNVAYNAVGTTVSSTWQGTNIDGLAITQVTSLDVNNVFFTINVKIKNPTADSVHNIYYMRTVDPDNDQTLPGGGFTTINKIEYQLPNTLGATMVSAQGTAYASAWLGLGTLDCRARCFYITASSLAPTVDCDVIYNGTTSTVSYTGTQTQDAGIGLVFSLGSLAPGDSATFAYAYVLKASDLLQALSTTASSYSASNDTVTSRISRDTAAVCQGTSTTVSVENPGSAVWNWISLTGEPLSTYTGTSTTVTPGLTLVRLLAIGTGAGCGGLNDTLYININPSRPMPTAPVVGSNSPVCTGNTLLLTATSTTGSTYNWSGPLSFTSTLQNPSISGVTLGAAGVYSVVATLGGCSTGVAGTTTVTINPTPAAISPSTASVCPLSNVTLSDPTSGGTWSSTATSVATVSGGVVTGVAAGVTTISYTVGTCAATATVTVNAAPAPITPSSPVSICLGSSSALADASPGGTWTSGSTGIATVSGSGVVTGVSLGTANITYTAGGCFAVKPVTVISTPAPIAPASSTVCAGNNVTLTDATLGGLWSASNSNATVSGGVVTGVTPGRDTIIYTVGTCSVTATVSVSATPAAITPSGPVSLCVGGTTTLSDASPGGIWSSGDITKATVSAGGLVTAIGAGVVNISYTNGGGCNAVKSITINPNPAAISPGSATVCIGNTVALSDATTGGVWSVTNANASVAAGVVTGISTGVDTVVYTTGSCSVAATVTVNANPAAITPATPVTLCVGNTITLSDATPGGTWSSGSTTIASVSAGGLVTALSAGAVNISYTNGSGCSAVKNITVNITPTPVSPASATVCVGNTVTLTDGVGGGSWTSSAPSVATVVGGVVTGVGPGSATITYAIGTCQVTSTVSVSAVTGAGSITGPSSVCVGSTIPLVDGTPGGVWSSANPSLASVSGSGVVTGLAGGLATISYTITTACGAVAATATVNVVATGVSPIVGPSMICAGTFATLTDATPSGSWSSSNSSATISGAGLLTGVSPGTDTITYTVTNVCGTSSTSKVVTIGAFLTAGTILGGSTVCMGSTLTLTDLAPGGVWGATNANATVAGGVVTGITAGVDTITYSVASGCGSATAMHAVTVNPLPNAGTIVGPGSLCIGTGATYTDAVAGGVWSITNSNASISGAGVVTPLATGLDTIKYTFTNACGTAVATKVISIGALLSAGTITGPASVCVGSTIVLTDVTPGGVWSTSNTTASVGITGLVTGLASGVDTISYTVTSSCGTAAATRIVTVNPLPDAGSIIGASSVCIGSTATFTNAATGGVWSMSNSRATISGSGILTPVSIGTDTIIYTVTNSCGTAVALKVITIGGTVTAGTISGPSSVCVGASVTLTDPVPGGIWSASNGHAIVSGTGLVSGVSAGVDTIAYSFITGCGTVAATYIVTVNLTTPTGVITGPASVCAGSSITVADALSGGTWSMSNGHATISSIGLINALTTGLDTVSYTVSGACGTASATRVISVDGTPFAGTITGPGSVCVGASVTLSDAATGGLWRSANANAIVDSITGVVTGVSAGTDVISYVVINACGMAVATTTLTVNPLPAAGTITGPDSLCIGAAITLVDVVPGGTWSAGNTNATVSASGVVTGLAAGTDPITYSVTNVCGTATAVKIVTITSLPSAGTILGISNVCVGSGITLTATVPGGTWSVSNAHASVSGPGIIGGVSVGVDTVFYTVSSGCGSAIAVKVISVNPVPVVAAISGPTTQCTGTTITLSDGTPGGVWTSSDATIATIGASSGIATGIAAGVVTLTYSVTNMFGCPGTATILDTVSLASAIPSISGPADVCLGASVTLSDALPGGTWSSSAPSIALVGAGTGAVTGITAGVATITYTVVNSCGSVFVVRSETVNPLPVVAAITGSPVECAGSATALASATPGGIWTSSNTAIATVGSSSGIVTGVAAGTVAISYTVTNSFGCSATVSVINTVNPAPVVAPISGITNQCVSASTTLSDATIGGIWTSSDPSIAAVSSTGIVSGISGGVVTIMYAVTAAGCTTTMSVSDTVNVMPVPSPIIGATVVCAGSSATLTHAGFAGVWSSSNPLVATISSSGVVTGVAAGTAWIYYAISNSCGAVTDSVLMTVQPVPAAGAITGPTTVCQGATVTLSETVAGGIWSMANSHAAIGSASGVVSGISAGIDTVIYTFSNSCGTAVATRAIAVSALPYPGVIAGFTSVCAGQTIALTESVSGGTWSSSNNAVATVSSGLVAGITAGTVTISYSKSNSCGTRSATHAVTVVPAALCSTGVNIVSPSAGEIRIFPNPATSQLNIQADQSVNVIVMTIEGKRVMEYNQVSSIDISSLADGMYFISVYAQDGVLLKTAKFAKTR